MEANSQSDALALLREIDASGVLYAHNLELDAKVANFLSALAKAPPSETAAPTSSAACVVDALDEGCICKGNWRSIVKETAPMIGQRFKEGDDEYTFFGIVHGGDDYYYGMSGKKGLRLLSCVGSIKTFGFEHVPTPKGDAR